MKVAIDEINAAGGLLGKKIELKVYDGQSNIKNYPRYAQQAALEDKVVMLQGSITGASREATRPVCVVTMFRLFMGRSTKAGFAN